MAISLRFGEPSEMRLLSATLFQLALRLVVRFSLRVAIVPIALLVLVATPTNSSAQNSFEDRPITTVSIDYEAGDDGRSGPGTEAFRLIAMRALGERFAAVRVRDAIANLYATNDIATIKVEAADEPNGGVNVRFLIKRKTVAQRVNVQITSDAENVPSEEELLLRINLLDPGANISERTLQNNADLILEYLRDRGFYRAEARVEQTPLQNPIEVAVTFYVTTGPQATIEDFNVDISGAENAALRQEVELVPGEPFTQQKLSDDVVAIRSGLREQGFLAPTLSEPRVVYDSSTNKISIEITGNAGPTVEVNVEAENYDVGSSTLDRLIPIRNEGTLDYVAIIEGERRLENYFQERGFFFAEVRPVCSVEPPLTEIDQTAIANNTEYVCSTLNNSNLSGKTVVVKYQADLGRRYTLNEIRIQGTDLFTYEEISAVLESREANILGVIPIFGYGRGLTSERRLEQDAATIRSLLRELGYRDATVRVNRGASIEGDGLIITFVVEEGRPTKIVEVAINGNSAFTDDVLRDRLPVLVGENFSRAKVRNGQRQLAEYYSQAGYFDATVDFSVDELPNDADTGDGRFRVNYLVRNEGVPVYVNRVLIAGNDRTKESAIRRAVTLEPNELLRSSDVYASEQNLYASDAFEQVDITTRPAGDRADGGRYADLLVEVREQAPRLLQYGGGYSTDNGLSGFVDLRHFNLLGNLWQGGARVQWSQRRQIVQFDFIHPRFLRDGENRFAPLTISAQYQQDSTVTRFFRSAFDRGTFGIVQRLDEEGNPIDQFGNNTGSPTLNRLTFTAETNRTISRKDRSIFFLKYRFERVRLANIESLLIRELLEPDSRIRISGFGATFVRDTRKRCNIEYTILEIIDRGGPGEPCRYNAGDPTNGDYLTAEYNVSVPALGANIGFHKFQASYNYYYTFPRLNNTTVAARAIIGLASVFSRPTSFAGTQFPELDDSLPISERFFAGGANTLRGFEFESAGPRVVIVPQGVFRNSDGEQVFLEPFTVPFGGNALAVVNIEARVPFTDWLRVVPFYDGGNVFRRVGDIFDPPDVPPTDLTRQNLRALWTHTVGLGLRVKTPIGGELGVDYGYLLNRPTFLIPQDMGPPLTFSPPRGQFHFRFSQAF